nr:tombus P22-like movement protein [Tolivirales sp.]
MEIQSLEGYFEEALEIQRESKRVLVTHNTHHSVVSLAPRSLLSTWKVPKTGYYVPTDVTFVLTPHLSEKAGVKAVVQLVDSRQMSPSRVLYRTQEFNLGTGIAIEGSQLPFCLPVGEYPIQFEVKVSQSSFKETARLYTTSLQWHMMCSPTPLSRVRSVMGSAQPPAAIVTPNFKMQLESSKGRAKNKSTGSKSAPKQVPLAM